MPKNAIIVISLVEESVEKSSEEIEREIFDELSRGLPFECLLYYLNQGNYET